MIAADRPVDEARQAIGLVDAGIEFEFEFRGMPQSETATDLAAQESGCTSEPSGDFLGRMSAAKGHKQHPRRAHVSCGAHGGDGHHADARILHFSRNELCDDSLELGFDALLTSLAGHDEACDQAIARATSTRE